VDDAANGQFSLFGPPAPPSPPADAASETMKLIQDFDIDTSTPLEALELIKRIQERTEKE
jgi:hypothetical protein